MKSEIMSETRFADLAAAWGGELRRWPLEHQAAARALVDARPVATGRLLFEARQLDAALETAPGLPVSAELRDRVIAAAAEAGPGARAVWPGLRRLLWIGGTGWAAAACAGVVFGVTLTAPKTVEPEVDILLDAAAVTGLEDPEWLG
jgi:hypothetical protein